MCGITGIVSRERLSPNHLEPLARMVDAMAHRGPDGAGRFVDSHVALAMRQLSIIDPKTSWQPLYNEDDSLVLIANGEIYNYIELRDRLVALGHRFRTRGDCETILHLYEEHGPDCVHHLRGMFAFALWDARRQRLLLARDRMGEKPLYLHERDGEIVFGSELKTLLRSGRVPFALNPSAVDLYFHYQYVPEPLTPIRGVRKLPPAHRLIVSLAPWSVKEECYWRMEDAPAIDGDPAAVIRAELETISEIVIRSDVPVGVALSGGLDSSAIAALAARKYPGTMHAFSVGYSDHHRSDERKYARRLAAHLGMPFHDIEIDTPAMVEAFPSLVSWQDDPIADIAGYGYYSLAQEARKAGVPVLLQGHGADELFWGYPWVIEAARQSCRKARLGRARIRDIPQYFRVSAPRFWSRRGQLDWALSLSGLRSSWVAFQRDCLSPRERLVFYELAPDFHAASKTMRRLYESRFQESLDHQSPFDAFTFPTPWPPIEILMTRLICQTYLLENGLAQCDRLSMASSVELRLPLVDYRLVEIVIGLRKARSDLKLRPKAWLREAVRDVVPGWVLDRPKWGFHPPVRRWHRALFERYGTRLRDGLLVELGVLEPKAARQLAEGRFPLEAIAPLSFKALVLELWCRQALAGEVPERAEASLATSSC